MGHFKLRQKINFSHITILRYLLYTCHGQSITFSCIQNQTILSSLSKNEGRSSTRYNIAPERSRIAQDLSLYQDNPVMTRSNHPLLLLGECALSASHALALSDDIQSPHRLFRLRKSALNRHGSNDMEEMAVPNETAGVQTFADDGENTSVEGLVEVVVETLDDVDTSRQKDDDGLLSMDTGGVDDIEFQECVEVMVCPDPACAEMEEVDIDEPTLFHRKSLLLRRHLESKTKKANKEHQHHSSKSDTSASTAKMPVSESMIIDDVVTTSKIPPTTGDMAHEEHHDQVA
jgi:hypothetical protein